MSLFIKDMTLREFAESLGVNKIVASNRFYTFYGHPIVELPPHGDLIDVQKEMRLMQSSDYDTYNDYRRAFDMLDNAPTIIAAEE